MKYHLCCNQVRGLWEVRNPKEEVVYNGTLEEASNYIDRLVKEKMGVSV